MPLVFMMSTDISSPQRLINKHIKYETYFPKKTVKAISKLLNTKIEKLWYSTW